MTQEEIVGVIEALDERLRRLEEVLFLVRSVPPEKVSYPMLAIADGVNWNPGGGAGMYLSLDRGLTWTKL